MRPTHLFAQENYLTGSEFAIVSKGTSWNCVISENTFKTLAAPFAYSDSYLAASDPALRASATINVPSTILLTDTISPAGDFDLFGLNVVAGQTYMISVYGSGSSPLTDSVIFLLDNGFNLVDLDDDGGSSTNSLLTFTAAYTGQYIIDVEAYPGSGLSGQYTLDVILQPATDVVDSTFADAPLIAPGVSYGFIDSPVPDVYGFAGETDTFKIEMEAGKFYTIEVAGGADYMSDWFDLPPGELDPWIFLYDSSGNEVANNDDISFPSDISSQIGFFAQESGTYFLDVQSWAPWTGGYSITLSEVNPADFNPLDAINWFSADNVDPGPDGLVKVYFAAPGESFGELADNGVDPLPSFGWNAFEKQQIFQALSEYTKITGLQYVETTNSAEADFRLITTTSDDFGAYFYPQDPAFGDAQGIGAFNVDSGGWDFDQQQSLVQGGFAFAVMLHEFGHAHGLAHPHDHGGGSEILLGVTGPFDSFGVYDLNQGVYTVMSYNDAWQLHPDGPSPFTAAGVDNGWSGTLSAFDIAVLQERYGVHAFATGNNVYQLKDVEDQGTYYSTIWDTGGTDEIRYTGARNAQIDLTAATLDYTPTGGGVISFVDDIHGGYTIANGVVIENASGGTGDDILIGNAVANVLKGSGGDDFLMGGAGGDNLQGGAGVDTASYMNAGAGVTASLASNSGSAGDAAGDTFNGIENLIGSNFADVLISGNASNELSGLAGNDHLTGGNGDDTLDGGAGNDLLDGGNQDDVLSGGDGDDVMSGGNQEDVLSGGSGNDSLDGGNQNDLLSGDGGDDILNGGNQDDELSGGAGTDNLFGGNQNDVLDGGSGDDMLDGGNQNDVLNGGLGNDYLAGGNQDDVLNGGAGNDTLVGGNQNDRYVFTETGGADVISGFNHSQDRIDLGGIDAVAGGADNAFTWIGAAAFSGVAGQLRSFNSGGFHYLAGDVNGDSVADFTIQTTTAIVMTDIIAF